MIIAIDDGVDPAHAPRPVNAAERTVFAQVYETLVRVDCAGMVRPQLAESWSRPPDGRSWLFTLREGARFHDGSPVTSRDVVESWTRPGRGSGSGAAPIASIATLGERVVRVEMAAAAEAEPVLFAAPALAVHRAAATGWALGTGVYEPDVDAAADGVLRLRPERAEDGNAVAARAATGATALVALEFRGIRGDARNALDAGVDVLVTRDPSVIDYATRHPSFTAASLPWEAAYVLFIPGSAASTDSSVSGALPLPVLEELARDAVAVEARVAVAAGWKCPGPARAPERGSRSGARIAFPRGDRAAAGLAERLGALSRPVNGRAPAWLADVFASSVALAAAPLAPSEMTATLRGGSAAAFVLPVDLREIGWCPDVAGRSAVRAIPLVEVRGTAIVRRGLEGIVVDGTATLHFEGARRRAEGGR